MNGNYRMGELEYQTAASGDLLGWNLALSQTTNPVGLNLPPVGYEWVTFRLTPEAGGLPQAFGRVKVGLH